MFLTQFIARTLHRAWGLHCDEGCRETPQPSYSARESLLQRLAAPGCYHCTDHCTPVSSHCHWQDEKAAGLNRSPAAHLPCSLNPPLSDILSLNRICEVPTCTVGCTGPCFISTCKDSHFLGPSWAKGGIFSTPPTLLYRKRVHNTLRLKCIHIYTYTHRSNTSL